MHIIRDLAEWQHLRRGFAAEQRIGFVPTMGNLHQGHLSLFVASRSENDINVASVFVNPTQFNSIEDFKHYPKTLDEDISLLHQAEVDYCLLPEKEALYPDAYRYKIIENAATTILEGLKRPGHFDGVLTVVMRLLQLVRPHRCYFGEKDYQQYCLIRDMARAFFLEARIQLCPTVREPSGLAYSSRNSRLTPEERVLAEKFAAIFHQAKTCEEIHTELSALGVAVDYIAEHEQRRFAAVQIGNVRLIDNYSLETSASELAQERS